MQGVKIHLHIKPLEKKLKHMLFHIRLLVLKEDNFKTMKQHFKHCQKALFSYNMGQDLLLMP